VIPIVPAIAAGGAAILVESAVHPLRNWAMSQFLWDDTARAYNAWTDKPYLVPSAEQLLEAEARMPSPDPSDPSGATIDPWIEWGLRKGGIALASGLEGYSWCCRSQYVRHPPFVATRAS
jgi:hypothetical protein